MVDMSKSLASFHLSSGGQIPNTNSSQSEKFLRNKTAMDESVDHLFKEGESVAPQEGSSKGNFFKNLFTILILQYNSRPVIFSPKILILHHSGPENFQKYRPKKFVISNKSISRKKFFDKNPFFAISKMAKK